ncbi:hypothetical protein EHJ07_08495 [Cronobacter muytjensii]|nr:hypothetical protein [Cronobacter muytjensii]
MTTIVPVMQDSVAARSDYYTRKKSPDSIAITSEGVENVRSGKNTAVTKSEEEQATALQNMLAQRRAVLEQQATASVPGIVMHSDIADNFDGFSALSSLSFFDTGTLLCEALNAPENSMNSSTTDMDLAMKQAKLNYIVSHYVPQENQAKAQSIVADWLSKQTTGQDDVMKTMTKAFIDIAKQTGDMASMKQYENQLSLLDAGKHESQIQRAGTLAITTQTANPAAWFAGFTSKVNENTAPASVKPLEKAHIDALKSHWEHFLARAGNVNR